jgi:hypothetical protein
LAVSYGKVNEERAEITEAAIKINVGKYKFCYIKGKTI